MNTSFDVQFPVWVIVLPGDKVKGLMQVSVPSCEKSLAVFMDRKTAEEKLSVDGNTTHAPKMIDAPLMDGLLKHLEAKRFTHAFIYRNVSEGFPVTIAQFRFAINMHREKNDQI